jgi:hypothetical protein
MAKPFPGIINVSGQPYLDLEREAVATMASE